MDFSKRAEALRTPGQRKLIQERTEETEKKKMGLSATQYWKTQVKTRNDILTYYSIYHPEYPEELCEALADSIDRMLTRMNNEPLYRKAFMDVQEMKKNKLMSEKWDYKEDLRKSKEIVQIQQCMKRLENLAVDIIKDEQDDQVTIKN